MTRVKAAQEVAARLNAQLAARPAGPPTHAFPSTPHMSGPMMPGLPSMLGPPGLPPAMGTPFTPTGEINPLVAAAQAVANKFAAAVCCQYLVPQSQIPHTCTSLRYYRLSCMGLRVIRRQS